MSKALIAMSGGVDSSLAAKLTIDAGFDCIGCTMKLYDGEDTSSGSHTCCSLSDVEDARSVAFKLGIPYYVFNFKDDFNDKVIKHFIESYEAGITPNPCIDCNRYMKFDKLFERAKVLGCDYVVTGHYARIEKADGKFILKKALDASKDQSYVLYSMTQYQLEHAMFPLGGLKKTEVRKIAEENSFVNASKPDSQDICFVPDGDYASFLERATGKEYPEGDFVDEEGNVLGRHKGLIHYTVGQRKGLGIALGVPMFVKKINTEDNTVVLSSDKALYGKELCLKGFNWISGAVPDGPLRCTAKIRYKHEEKPATATPLTDGMVKLEFDEPVRAITPGQAAVIYDSDIVLGGGTIAKE